ncbi:uncharacterized protein LOC127081409 [Lathyrus oleraceus]|uniref:uncharacterized protein LOC127081409 n=1 Tax=Pisum sativum TaxID=3888 RepID=UPI0021CFB7BE|nr:uncharacterized protein LOC127081409 [Pisum sativum]
MLGRQINFKALENRLQQMWARRGVIDIVDLNQEFFLATFTGEEEQKFVFFEGPWMIYDRYLKAREWSADFCSVGDAIEQLDVFVRIFRLPIEYYDTKVLTYIGNRFWKTVNVYKNTLLKEIGKYARICVQVDLIKLFLAMFSIKGHYYKVEYEVIHLLCLTRGRFGHNSDGCSEMKFEMAELSAI